MDQPSLVGVAAAMEARPVPMECHRKEEMAIVVESVVILVEGGKSALDGSNYQMAPRYPEEWGCFVLCTFLDLMSFHESTY